MTLSQKGFRIRSKSFQGTHEKPEGQKRLGSKDAHLRGHIGDTKPIEDGQDNAVEDGQGSGGLPLADLTGILAQGHIAPIVQLVLNRPVVSDEFEQALRSGLLGSQTAQTHTRSAGYI